MADSEHSRDAEEMGEGLPPKPQEGSYRAGTSGSWCSDSVEGRL